MYCFKKKIDALTDRFNGMHKMTSPVLEVIVLYFVSQHVMRGRKNRQCSCRFCFFKGCPIEIGKHSVFCFCFVFFLFFN